MIVPPRPKPPTPPAQQARLILKGHAEAVTLLLGLLIGFIAGRL